MSNVSSSNGLEKYPKLRFKGFTEPWKSIKFCDLFEYIPNNTLSRADLNYQQGYAKNVHYGDVLIKFGPVLDIKNDTLPYITAVDNPRLISHTLQDGDIIIADTAEDETVGKATEIINTGLSKVVSGLHTIACRPKTTMHSTYLGFYINSPQYHKQLISLMQGIKVLSISKSNIESTILRYPCQQEQQKICKLLNLIENRIHKQHFIIETLKKYKRGLLQQIFSRKLRMCITDGDWDYIPLGEIGRFFGGLTGKSKEDFGHGESTFITYMNVYKNTFANKTMVSAVDVRANEKQNAVQYGDILFTQSSETVEEVGLTSVWTHTTTPYLNSFCMALRPHSLKKHNPYYLGYALRAPQIRQAIMREGQGISRINLSASRIENIMIPVPPIAVQIKIADCLIKLDDRILANEKTYTELVSLKKASLHSLFI